MLRDKKFLSLYAALFVALCSPASAQEDADSKGSGIGGFFRDLGKGISKTLQDAGARLGAGGKREIYQVKGKNEYCTKVDSGFSTPYAVKGTLSKDGFGNTIVIDDNSTVTRRSENTNQLKIDVLGTLSTTPCEQAEGNGLLALVGSGASTAPATAQNAGRTVGQPAGNIPADYNTIEDTELKGFFERHPQRGAGTVTQWPRVAITVLEIPAWGFERHRAASTIRSLQSQIRMGGPGCWKFKARIWESASRSRDVPSFYKCTPPDTTIFVSRDVEEVKFVAWTGLFGDARIHAMGKGSTGIDRTEGPTPPDFVFPRTNALVRKFPGTWTYMVLNEITYKSGIAYESIERRMWVNFDPSINMPNGT